MSISLLAHAGYASLCDSILFHKMPEASRDSGVIGIRHVKEYIYLFIKKIYSFSIIYIRYTAACLFKCEGLMLTESSIGAGFSPDRDHNGFISRGIAALGNVPHRDQRVRLRVIGRSTACRDLIGYNCEPRQ
jgi:hypothetical protein